MVFFVGKVGIVQGIFRVFADLLFPLLGAYIIHLLNNAFH